MRTFFRLHGCSHGSCDRVFGSGALCHGLLPGFAASLRGRAVRRHCALQDDQAISALIVLPRLRSCCTGGEVLSPVVLAAHVKAHLPRIGRVPTAGLISELNVLIGLDRVDRIGHDA